MVKIAGQRKNMNFLNQNILLYIAAYLVSAIPFGYLLAKQFAGVDIKSEGSGNIGATNVLRVVKRKNPKLAKKLGASTLLLDALKGAIIILIARAIGAPEGVQWTLAVLSVLGHCFSPFLEFEGGKGIATGFGVLLVMLPVSALIALAVWFVSKKLLKIVSLSSLIALFTLVIASFIFKENAFGTSYHAPVLIIAIIIFYKHIPNLVRLFKKEEHKVA